MTDQEFEIERARIQAEKELLIASTALSRERTAGIEEQMSKTETEMTLLEQRRQSLSYGRVAPLSPIEKD